MVKTLFKPEMYISAAHAEKPPRPMGISFVRVGIIEMHIGKGTVPSVRHEVGWAGCRQLQGQAGFMLTTSMRGGFLTPEPLLK